MTLLGRSRRRRIIAGLVGVGSIKALIAYGADAQDVQTRMNATNTARIATWYAEHPTALAVAVTGATMDHGDREAGSVPSPGATPPPPPLEAVNQPHRTSARDFLLLVGILSIPFWLVGAAGGRFPIPILLPISALMAFTPMLAALVLTYNEGGTGAAVALLARTLDFRRVRSTSWLFAALVLMPLVFLLEYGVLRQRGAIPRDALTSFAGAPLLFSMFFIGAIGEELGWQGYAFARLKGERTVLGASLILGTVWALWHVIPFIQTGRSPDWIIWQCLSTVALRVIIVGFVANTGQSVFIAVLVHTTYNFAWGLFPNHGSYYDPLVTFVILAFIACAITVLWGPATLARGTARSQPNPQTTGGAPWRALLR